MKSVPRTNSNVLCRKPARRVWAVAVSSRFSFFMPKSAPFEGSCTSPFAWGFLLVCMHIRRLHLHLHVHVHLHVYLHLHVQARSLCLWMMSHSSGTGFVVILYPILHNFHIALRTSEIHLPQQSSMHSLNADSYVNAYVAKHNVGRQTCAMACRHVAVATSTYAHMHGCNHALDHTNHRCSCRCGCRCSHRCSCRCGCRCSCRLRDLVIAAMN